MTYPITEFMPEAKTDQSNQIVSGEELAANIHDHFGKWVVVTKEYGRNRRSGHIKEWVSTKRPSFPALLIGVRTLRNGRAYYYTDHTEWQPTGDPIKALLVVSGPHRRPKLIPLDGAFRRPGLSLAQLKQATGIGGNNG